ncbi:hypothetical protein CLV78_11923 [Aliiruegeria haliotis]|uniref:Uncharacterized protein n=1 Tax=Aliiruegeria haliotis TaxID=1280846 RepID=A0A2T0REY6_9RHOB|nr:hypothetical protein [Aliiruegeria haliotis]PRY19691.1 hypothetical protein CLV78_11923 [Aliiruegeria haliotis]
MPDDYLPTKVLQTVLEQDVGDGAVIRRLFIGDESFRSACEDFVLASEMLLRFESVTDGSRQAEVADYRDMKATLLDELRHIIGQSKVPGATGGPLS